MEGFLALTLSTQYLVNIMIKGGAGCLVSTLLFLNMSESFRSLLNDGTTEFKFNFEDNKLFSEQQIRIAHLRKLFHSIQN